MSDVADNTLLGAEERQAYQLVVLGSIIYADCIIVKPAICSCFLFSMLLAAENCALLTELCAWQNQLHVNRCCQFFRACWPPLAQKAALLQLSVGHERKVVGCSCAFSWVEALSQCWLLWIMFIPNYYTI